MNPSFQNQFAQKQSVMPANQFAMQPMQPIQGLNNNLMAGWGQQPTASNFMSGDAINSGTTINPNMGGMSSLGNFGVSNVTGGSPTQPPAKVGDWTNKASFGLGVAQVGLGVYNAMEQSKMNKFMKSYYGDQMDMMKADFSSAAKDANSRLQWQQQERLASQGQDINSKESQQSIAEYMARWGAQETV